MNFQLNSVQMIFVGLFILLTVATLVTALKARLQPERNFTELKLRVRSWWLIVILFAIAMLSSLKVSMVFFTFVAFLSFKEYLSLIPMRRADRRVLFWAYLAIPIQF
ncbi:phosphatidate cytidylyltransferase, partial [bacterium]|nr:phosphatidate cytidylyltransferase [bacterium]